MNSLSIHLVPIYLLFRYPNIALGDCSCDEYVNAAGYGDCKKIYRHGLACYVSQPSTCKDLVNSTQEAGKQISWEACKKSPSKLEKYCLISLEI